MPDAILFSWGPLTIRWYGVLIVTGMAVGVFLACRETRRQELNPDHFFNMCLAVLPAAIIGSRLYYVAFNWAYYSADPVRIFALWEGGLAIHGGIIGGALAFIVMGIYYRFGVWKAFDITAPSLVLGQAIGRWGNFFNQEAYGYEVSPQKIPWAMFIDGAYRHPTFLYESIWDVLIFAFLLWYRRRRNLVTGDVALMYIILYSAGRLVIESFRTDSLMLGGWRVAQLVSAAAIILAPLIMWLRRRGSNQGGRIINIR
jgi:phosphatidylglycerol:prolipoprotein diacylglycerol transferase